MSIAIFTEESSLFAAPFLAEALDAPLYVMLPQYNNFFASGVQGKFWEGGDAIREDHLIVIGAVALKNIASRIEAGRYKTVAVIFSDSAFCRDYEWTNDFIAKNNITVYAMPDNITYLECPVIPAYQTIRISVPETKKYNRLTVSHSPNNPAKSILKGTPQIINTIEKVKKLHDFDFVLIQDKPMKECLQIKVSSHIFIDQLIQGNPHVPQDYFGNKIRYHGGLGKSGLEAMLMGVVVITGGTVPQTEPYFPPPPVKWTSLGMFYDDLKALIIDDAHRDIIAKEQKQWAEKYLSAEFIRKHITQHIKE